MLYSRIHDIRFNKNMQNSKQDSKQEDKDKNKDLYAIQ